MYFEGMLRTQSKGYGVRMMQAALLPRQWEPYHVRFGSTNQGRREYYAVMRESERNVSGTAVARFPTRELAQQYCDAHNSQKP